MQPGNYAKNQDLVSKNVLTKYIEEKLLYSTLITMHFNLYLEGKEK